jgi:peptide/nickel transport system substrate-binding protein
MTLRRLVTSIIALALGLAGLASCGTENNGDTLVLAIEAVPKSLDPRLGSVDAASARIHQLLFDTLVRKDARFDIVPHIAESVDQSPDAKTFTFKLRPGITFHDGRELTSADVKYTFDSIRSPELKSPVAAAFNRIESIETPDPLTAIFHAREPYYTLLGDLVAVGVIATGTGDAAGIVPVGTGPYKLEAHDEQTIELAANDGYFGGAPKIKKVRVKVVAQNNTRQLEISNGDTDLAVNTSFSPDTVKQMQMDPDLQVVITPGTNVAYVGINTQDKVLSDARVRRAIALGLDRKTIIDTLYQGQARSADGILPPESSAYEPTLTKYERDISGAVSLLDQAGYPDPDGAGPQPRLSLDFTTTNVGLAPQIGQIVQEQLKAVGIAIRLNQYELSTFFERLNNGQFQLFYAMLVGGNQSPDIFQSAYHSRYKDATLDAAAQKVRAAGRAEDVAAEIATMSEVLDRKGYCPSTEVDRLLAAARTAEPAVKRQKLLEAYDLTSARGSLNRGRYCNPALDDLIIRAERSTDPAEKRSLYGEIQKTASRELPQIYLWYPANVVVARKRLGNIAIDPSGAWYFVKDVTL